MPPLAVCIGLSRTGTKSFGEAAEALGFGPRLGWTDRSEGLMRAWHDGRIDDLLAAAAPFQVLHDIPWAFVYENLAVEFPDAKFVLTRRSSVEVWLRSIVAHTNRSPSYWGHEAAYGAAMPADDPGVYCRSYVEHLERARAFFRGSDRMIEVCWESGSGWKDLCGLLGASAPKGVPFPHSGALASKPASEPSPA